MKNDRNLTYISMFINNLGKIRVAVKNREDIEYKNINSIKNLYSWIEKYQEDKKVKINAVAILSNNSILASELWLKHDIVPFFYSFQDLEINNLDLALTEALIDVKNKFFENGLIKVNISENNKVEVNYLVDLNYYNGYNGGNYDGDFDRLLFFKERLKDKKIVFVNSTPRGGGVALMRHALIRLYNLLNMQISWHVVAPDEKIFNITKKKFHNVLQNIKLPSEDITDEEKTLYEKWIKRNYFKLKNVFDKADVIIIDDPQPSGLIKYIKRDYPNKRVIYRSHIQIDSNALENVDIVKKTWKYLRSNIKKADLFVSHPILEFIPKDLNKKNVVLMPATTDALDGLNKKLTEKQINYYINMFNNILRESGQKELDLERPYIIQIARFDPSKGIPDVLKSYKLFRDRLLSLKSENFDIPQLVITGHSAIDDPEAIEVYENTLRLIDEHYKDIKDDIKVAILPGYDQLLNTLMRKSYVVLQLSYREGFEVKVTEALSKGKPVIAYNTGGIPLQIEHNLTGFLVDVGDTDKVAKYIFELYNNSIFDKFSNNAMKYYNKLYFTLSNAVNWLFLVDRLLHNFNFQANSKNVRELINNFEIELKKRN